MWRLPVLQSEETTCYNVGGMKLHCGGSQAHAVGLERGKCYAAGYACR